MDRERTAPSRCSSRSSAIAPSPSSVCPP